MFVWASLLGGSVDSVIAQAVATSPSIRYEAAAACPPQSVFAERMRARLKLDATRVPSGISLHVVLAERGAATHGSVEIERGATKTQRTIDGASCEEVADALALIAALALSELNTESALDDKAKRGQARRRERTTERRTQAAGASKRSSAPAQLGDKTPSGGRTANRAAGEPSKEREIAADLRANAESGMGAARERDGATPAPGAAGAIEGAASGMQSASTTADSNLAAAHSGAATPGGAAAAHSGAAAAHSGAATRGGTAAQSGTADAQTNGTARPASASGSRALAVAASNTIDGPRDVASARTPWRYSAGIAAAGLVFSGLAPRMQPGLQLQAALNLSSDAVTFSLQLGGRIARNDHLTSPNGDAWFGFVGGLVRLCGSSSLGTTRFALGGCAVAEPGVFSAGGENTANRRSHSRLWLAAGAATDVSVRAASWLRLRAGAELLAPFRRDRVSLAGDTLYRIPALGLRLHLGLEVPFG